MKTSLHSTLHDNTACDTVVKKVFVSGWRFASSSLIERRICYNVVASNYQRTKATSALLPRFQNATARHGLNLRPRDHIESSPSIDALDLRFPVFRTRRIRRRILGTHAVDKDSCVFCCQHFLAVSNVHWQSFCMCTLHIVTVEMMVSTLQQTENRNLLILLSTAKCVTAIFRK
jgi:hypothetical protein